MTTYVFEFQTSFEFHKKKFFATIEIRMVASSVIYRHQWNVLKLHVRLHGNLLFEIFSTFSSLLFVLVDKMKKKKKKWKDSKNPATCNENQYQKYFSNDITSKTATITNNNMVLCTDLQYWFNVQRYFEFYSQYFILPQNIVCVWLKDNRQSSHSFRALAN